MPISSRNPVLQSHLISQNIFAWRSKVSLFQNTKLSATAPEKTHFLMKKNFFFLFLKKNINCGYSLEVPH